MQKRKSHEIHPEELELRQMEFKLVMGDSWEHLELLINSIFCTCDNEGKKLVN